MAQDGEPSFVQSIKNKADFDSRMKQATGLVCVDFYADWCGPCKMMTPKIEALAKAHPLVLFLKLDVDEVEEVAIEYDIACMPTFMFFKNGEKLATVTGTNEDELKQAIANLIEN